MGRTLIVEVVALRHMTPVLSLKGKAVVLGCLLSPVVSEKACQRVEAPVFDFEKEYWVLGL